MIKRLVVLIWRASPRFFLYTLGMNLVDGLLPLGRIYVTSAMLALLADAAHGNASADILLHKLIILLGLTGGLAVLSAVLAQFSGTVEGLYQTRVANYIQGLIVKKAASLDLAFFENPEFHNTLQNASNEASARPFTIVQQLMDIASSMTTLISLGIMVLLWRAWLMPLILLPPLVLFWMTSGLAARNVEMRVRRTETARRAGYFQAVLTNPGPAKEIRLFNLSEFFVSSLYRVWDDMYAQDREFARRKLFSRGALAMAMSLNQPLVIGYVAEQLLRHQVTFRQFSLYTQAVASLQSRFKSLAVSLGQLYENNLFVASIFDFLSLQPKIEAPRPTGTTKGVTALPLVEFRHVCFRYPGAEALVLDDISFKLQPGDVMALVGDNGAGKTTIVKLLAGLYEPTSGQILLDGLDIAKFNRDELRNYFGMILQDFPIYNLSAHDNIGVGRIESIHSRAMIESAARAAGLDEIVGKLPHGYDTVLARNFKRGHELSGGQRQLVALSRALLRGSPILVMDEPTAALDVHHERHIFRKLLGAHRARQQSVLLICHRLTAVRHAQHILVLSEGRLVEEGNHQHLMALNGRYAEMFNLQLQMYGDSWLEDLEGDEAATGRNSGKIGGGKIA